MCAVQVEGDRFTLEKQAPVISYGAMADAILVTCRKSADASPHDQAQVLRHPVRRHADRASPRGTPSASAAPAAKASR